MARLIERNPGIPLTLNIPQTNIKIQFQSQWRVLIVAIIFVLIVVAPIASLGVALLNPDWELWEHMWNTFLPKVMQNTIVLTAGVGLGTFLIGTGFAWLVTAYEFPFRKWFERLFLLPLAIPGFIMGFVFMATFDFTGPVQTQLREWFGTSDWFPSIRSGEGAILVLTLVLYPYVYILARAAFREQSAATFETAQMMGFNRWQTFYKLVLPLARPSIAAGVILTMMEAMTDFGTVNFFSYPTLSERIVIVWTARYDQAGATQLASMLLIFAIGMVILERILRGQAKYYQQGGAGKGRRPSRVQLRGWGKWSAFGASASLLAIAFILPVATLIAWAIAEVQNPSVGAWQNIYGEYIGNTVLLSSVAAIIVVIIALAIAFGARANSIQGQHRWVRWLTRSVTLGYAMPGAVIAAGVLLVISPIDGQVTGFAENFLGYNNPAYLLTGTMVALTYAYVVRFMAVGFNSVDASLEKITPNMEHAARTLGARSPRVLRRIYFPLVSTGMAAGALIVFVDAMKELPATLLLRPFGMDTLALWAYFLGKESFWQASAIPSLTILAVGLIPVFMLMRVGERNAYD